MNRIMIVIAAMVLALYGCSVFDTAFNYFRENVEITWKPDKAKEAQPVDSIVITFKPVYWTEPPCDSSVSESEKSYTKYGYDIWRLRTTAKTRYEVVKKDTVIYLYKK